MFSLSDYGAHCNRDFDLDRIRMGDDLSRWCISAAGIPTVWMEQG